MKNVRFITLGCRVNQYETQGMRESLNRSGVMSAATEDSKVDFVVINTCTVTAKADRENRYWIRRAKREHPQAKVIVTGCGVERDRAAMEALSEVDLVLPNHEKADIAEHLGFGCGTPEVRDEIAAASVPRNKKHEYTPLSISASDGKTRAFIKIQDGCNHACSFCKVVLVRGRSRSRKLDDIVAEVKRLRDAGYRDVVFAGIQLGAYGLDFPEKEKLKISDVLYACAGIEGIDRLRLSSIEPTDVEDDLIEAMRSIDKCAHHLHIPLQSGDTDVLKGMNRRYPREFYITLIEKLRKAMPDFCLTMDVMAGFPGETEAMFQNTVELIKEVRPLRCHVFSYSAREGTRASRFEEEVSDEDKKTRVKRLIALSNELGDDVRSEYLGRVLPVLVERSKPNEDKNVHHGLTENYMKVVFKDSETSVGQIVHVSLQALEKDYLVGTVAEKEMLETEKGELRGSNSVILG